MAKKITDGSVTALTAPANGDLILINDISDTTDSSGGTSKRITWQNLLTGVLFSSVIGSTVQAWSAALDSWAGKTPPSGTVVGNTDIQTLTNKTIDYNANTLTNLPSSNIGSTSGFSVYLNSNQTINAGATTKILFDTKKYDLATEFDVVTNRRFTAKIAGTYLFTLCGLLQSVVDNTSINFCIYKNGAVINQNAVGFTTSPNESAPVIAIVQLAINDYIEFFVINNDVANRTLIGLPYWTYAMGQRLS